MVCIGCSFNYLPLPPPSLYSYPLVPEILIKHDESRGAVGVVPDRHELYGGAGGLPSQPDTDRGGTGKISLSPASVSASVSASASASAYAYASGFIYIF